MSVKSSDRVRPHSLTTLIELLKLRAGQAYVPVTSSEFGRRLGISQQAASNRLTDLERQGLIERGHAGRGFTVRITDRGMAKVIVFFEEFRETLQGQKRSLVFTGSVFTGLGEGGYYISRRGYQEQFLEKLGFKPYPGTLNLRLTLPGQREQRRQLQFLAGVEVLGFKDGKRSYGPVKCFKASVGRNPAAALAIERTHYDHSVLEIISSVNLRKSLKLADGSQCHVTVRLD